MTDINYPWPPLTLPDEAQHRYQLAHAIGRLRDGKSEAHGTVTFTANSATTTLSDKRIGVNTVVLLEPRTANAAAANNTWYIATKGDGTATITHANNAQADRLFGYALCG